MITSVAHLRSAGYRIDMGVTDAVLQRCIEYAERLWLREAIGTTALVAAQALPANDPLIKGDDTFSGLLRGLEYIAVSHLLMDDVFASTFGTIRKKDDNSVNADPWEVAKRYETIGRTIVRQYSEKVGCPYHSQSTTLTESL